MTLTPENSTFAQTKYMTNLSTILKKNVVIIKKHLKRKASSIEDEPKRILSSASKHLMYVLTSHHPIHTKIKDLFKTYNKDRNKSTQHENTKNNLDCEEEIFIEEQKDHGIGSNMTEQGMNIEHNYVPIILNVSVVEKETRHTSTSRNTKHRARQTYDRFENLPDLNRDMSHTKYDVPKRI